MEVKTYTPRELRMKVAEYALKQSEFAALVGVSQPHISALLRGMRGQSRLMRIRLAQVIAELDCVPPPDQLPPQQPEGVAPHARRL